jgi:hypothetical protein
MTKRAVVVAIALVVAALHFVTGRSYQGPCPAFVNGYLIDIVLPLQLFLLLSLIPHRRMAAPLFRASAVVGFGCLVETSQYLGMPIFGATFDPFDFLAYAGGVALGALLDLVLFPRLLPHWRDPDRQAP